MLFTRHILRRKDAEKLKIREQKGRAGHTVTNAAESGDAFQTKAENLGRERSLHNDNTSTKGRYDNLKTVSLTT